MRALMLGGVVQLAPILGALTLGSASSPVVRNNFDTTPAQFFLAAKLAPAGGSLIDALTIAVEEPANGLETTSLATTWAASGYVLGDYDPNANTSREPVLADERRDHVHIDRQNNWLADHREQG